jgi:hypothetical protein
VEVAERVWRRALELAQPFASHDRFALTRSSLANHDPVTMAHALTLDRTHLPAHSNDSDALGGVTILDNATLVPQRPSPTKAPSVGTNGGGL